MQKILHLPLATQQQLATQQDIKRPQITLDFFDAPVSFCIILQGSLLGNPKESTRNITQHSCATVPLRKAKNATPKLS
jgi:hypothetical protein